MRDLRVHYGLTPILKGVDLDVGAGEIVAIAGPNGSGKSTLLRSLIRSELTSTGEGEICGHSIFEDSSKYNTQIGYVSETLNFQVEASSREVAQLYQRLNPEFSIEHFENVASQFSLDILRPSNQYSRGQKVQFAFALAVAANPKLILLDEVTSVLDIHIRDVVMREVSRLVRQGTSALIATNILTEVIPYATRLLILESGKIELDTSLTNLSGKYVKFRLAEDQVSKVPGARIVKGALEGRVTCIAPANEAGVVGEEAESDVTAEDVFLYYCKGQRSA